MPYLHEASVRAGRAVPPAVALAASVRLADPRARVAGGRRPALSPGEALDLMRQYAAAGVSHLSLDLPSPSLDVFLRQMELFADGVLSAATTF